MSGILGDPLRGQAADVTVSAQDARRLLLHVQGLLDDPGRRGAASLPNVAKLIERIGFVQIDTINVIERAHHLILVSRIDDYDRSSLDVLQSAKHHRLFEHWTHDASYIPTKWFPHWRRRFEEFRASAWLAKRIGEDPDRLMEQVLDRIRREGPLRSQEFENTSPRNGSSAWWGWKPQKAALEHLWRRGELYVVGRVNFQKVYDLPERVVPHLHAQPTPDEQEHIAWACRSALQRLGIATAKEVRDFWNAIPVTDAKRWLEHAATTGEVIRVSVAAADGSPPRLAFALNDLARRIAKLPDAPARVRILAPFDPVIRERARTKRLFNFDYRFEAYVPKDKRRHGYYVMPILEGDRLIGRLDPKLHRDRAELEIRFVDFEPGVALTPARRQAVKEGIERLAKFVGASKIRLPRSRRHRL